MREFTDDGVKKYPKHKHMHWEIMYYIEGEGYLNTNGEKIAFKPGSIIAVPPGVEHGSVSKNGFKNISIAGEFGQFLSFNKPVLLEDTETGDGKLIVTLILNNMYGELEYLDSLCVAYLYFILQNISVENNIRDVVNKIAYKIREKAYDSRINLKEILLKSGYAEDYIRACFKRNMGFTPNEFLTKIRINHACALIDIYGKTVALSEVAEQCGYLDYVYFSRKFKKMMGISPKNYLENVSK